MNENKFTYSSESDFPTPINTISEIHSAVNVNYNNHYYSDLQVIRSINGKPITQKELTNNHMISKDGAMNIILTARRRAMEETQFNDSQNFTNWKQ